jgi:hypothetical protein
MDTDFQQRPSLAIAISMIWGCLPFLDSTNEMESFRPSDTRLERLHLLYRVIEPKSLRRHQRNRSFASHGDHRIGVGSRRGQRLFDQQRLAGFDCQPTDIRCTYWGSHHNDDIHGRISHQRLCLSVDFDWLGTEKIEPMLRMLPTDGPKGSDWQIVHDMPGVPKPVPAYSDQPYSDAIRSHAPLQWLS